MMHKINITSLSCGCGGRDLGFLYDDFDTSMERHSIHPEIIAACDSNSMATGMYAQNIIANVISSDITEINYKTIPQPIDIVIGQLPNDFNEELQYIGQLIQFNRPKIVYFDSYHNIPSIDRGQYLHAIIGTLSQLGYSVQYKQINTADYGIPIERKLFALVGISDYLGHIDIPLFEQPNNAHHLPLKAILQSDETEEDYIITKTRRDDALIIDEPCRIPVSKIPNAIIETRIPNIEPLSNHYCYRHLSIREIARMMSFPDSYYLNDNSKEAKKLLLNSTPPLVSRHIAQKLYSLLY